MTFAGGKTIIATARSDGTKEFDLVTELPLHELIKPPDKAFAPTMIASLKERVTTVEATVTKLAAGMETVPVEGDF